MPLEDGNWISDLVITNPPGTDGKSEGDNHIRLIKRLIKNTFPGAAGAWLFPQQNVQFREVTASQDVICSEIRAARGFITQDMQVGGLVTVAPNAAIAGAAINGVTGAIQGASFGVAAAQRVGNGDYEFLLDETLWGIDDLQIVATVDYSLLGAGSIIAGAGNTNTGPGWIRIVTTNNNEPNVASDANQFDFLVFDAGRNT